MRTGKSQRWKSNTLRCFLKWVVWKRQENQVPHPDPVMSLCSHPVSFTAFEKMYLENEDHMPAQFCWQPAMGPWVSHYVAYIYEGAWTRSERPGFRFKDLHFPELASQSMTTLNVSLKSTVELFLIDYLWWCSDWLVCHRKSFGLILCISCLLLL